MNAFTNPHTGLAIVSGYTGIRVRVYLRAVCHRIDLVYGPAEALATHDSTPLRDTTLAAWFFGLLLLTLGLTPAHADGEAYHGTVMRIAAADKLLVRTRNRTFRVRLAGIDAPQPGQPYGQAASRAMGRLVRGRKVRLVQVGAIRDGWMEAQVYRDGTHVNAELVRQGYARAARDEPDNPPLADLEAEARAARRGLWAEPHPMPPRQQGKRSVDRGNKTQ